MDITAIVSSEYESFPPDTRVAKLRGVFEDPSLKGIVVTTADGTYRGVVTRRQLSGSQYPPEQKIESLIWNVPRVRPDEDIREVARLMIDSDSHLLPVFEGDQMIGVVTVDGILTSVQSALKAATVEDAYTGELRTVTPETTFGQALHTLREHRIAHLPVVDGDRAVGILSLYDVIDIVTRAGQRSQGGDAGGRDAYGGQLTDSAGRSRGGGFGAREGELERIRDLPVRDIMVTPVRTIQRSATLNRAVEAMFDVGGSSLVVTASSGHPVGIITKTDLLESLTWSEAGNRAVQIYRTELLDDISYDGVVDLLDRFSDRGASLSVLDTKLHLHEHDEQQRGRPLLLARLRLYTDQGIFIGSGEGYGARQAIRTAIDVVDRQIREQQTYGQSKKHPDEEFWEKRFGWWLEG